MFKNMERMLENLLKESIISVYVKMCLRGVNLHFYVIKLTLS